MPRWLAWPTLALALVALNASLTFENIWPTPRVRAGASVSVEVALAVAMLTLAGRHADRFARWPLPTLWVGLVVGRYLDVTAPGLYGRAFNLYWDAPHLGNVAAMLAEAASAWQVAAGIAVALLALAAAWVAARWAWRRVADAAGHRWPRRLLAGAAAVVIVVFVVTPADSRTTAAVPLAHPVGAAYLQQMRYAVAFMEPGRAAPALAESPPLDRPLAALDRADVIIVFVEAYGAVTFGRPELASALVQSRARLDAAIRTAGRQVVSAYVDSPTFGASSWLAHLTLLTGLDVRDPFAYAAIMSTSRDSVPRMFGRHGYRTVAVMPGMRQSWPEGAFYGFDVIYDFAGLAYQGPRFGWWAIPDQFSLARLAQRELTAGARAPVLAVFPTGTTHAPFGPVPPYQPDWQRVLGPDPFDAADVVRALGSRPDLTNLGPDYARAVAYALTSFAGFVREQATASQVLILVGDHQPVAAVSGPGASYEVPVHVIASPGTVVDRLRAAGFTRGLTPSRPAVGGMHTLTTLLLDASR